MKNRIPSLVYRFSALCLLLSVLGLSTRTLIGAPATVLFQDEFTGTNPGWTGWTAVQPAGGIYLDGPMLWVYNHFSQTFSEDSNIYTDSATFSSSRIGVMLINDTVAPTSFSYTARMMACDDDAFGLVWGFQNESTFYRVIFPRQNRTAAGWPYQGWVVDRMNNGQITDLFRDTTFINTQYRPFDVTITVTNNQFTLTVVDDPDGAATVYNLVNDVLPTTAGGKVGLFSWGQNGNGGFRIGNPVLSPTPLTGGPNTLSNTWSATITPRSDGTTNLSSGVGPDWSLGINASGNRGWLVEHSDAFHGSDNTATGTTNYAAPTILAGDPAWSNYVYYARFQTGDDDGFGLVFRYLNETNFYRIGFRNQNSTSGIKRGWSVQKCVNLVFDQIAAGTTFIPALNTPIDVYVAIRTNRLLVLVVQNPASANPTRVTIGPFDITGGTVDQGKIGILSWAQSAASGTQVDFARVYEMVGESLFVNSPFGTPDPPVGVNNFPVSSTVTASVDNVVIEIPNARRQANVGFLGFGSVPVSGTSNQVVFTLNTLSGISWLWRTEFFLTTNANAGGTVSASAGPWIGEGSNVTVTATANPGFVFAGWSGDSVSISPNLTILMLRPISLVANFTPDTDGDELADNWELSYFGNLAQTAAGDPDGDGATNLSEFQGGTNPTAAEILTASDGLSSQWLNMQRDVALPGILRVVDFGAGYRGAFDDSNDNRSGNDFTFIASTNFGDYASFQGPRIIVKSNLWTDSWGSNFSASIEFSVGDNDANTFYFRYKDERNWYRATLCGEDPLGATARPALGLSIQRRLNGNYSNLPIVAVSGPAFAGYTDPTDGAGTPSGFKKVRLTVNATNDVFEVRSIGWNGLLSTPDFDTNAELVVTFTDNSHTSGRIGFGLWGMGGFGNNANQTNGIPIPLGGFVDNIVLKSPADGAVVFSENWETVPLTNEFPAGWSNPYTGTTLEGIWHMSAHGTIAQQGNVGPVTSGTAAAPKGDADGPILIGPNPMSVNYNLQIGFHPFDNDGIGFVYDYQDTNNYSRVIFRQEATFSSDIPPGLTVSRKSGGVWSDIVAGDPGFFYVPGRPFEVSFANNNGTYGLLARDLDNPVNTVRWRWSAPPATAGNRFGLTTWAFQDAHFLYARAYSLPVIIPFKITQITLSGGNVILDISKPTGSNYHVLRASSVTGPYVTNAANQSGAQYSEPAPVGGAYYRLQLLP